MRAASLLAPNPKHLTFVEAAAIQLAKAFGANVVTTVSGRNVDFVRSPGADEAIDCRGGLLVSIVSTPDTARAAEQGVCTAYCFLEPDGEKLARRGRLAAERKLRPVGALFPLAEAARAHELSESGHARGKVVLQVRGAGRR